MDFQLFDDHREFFGRYRLLNEKDGYLYSDLISIYVLDLNATDLATQEDKDHGLVIWAEMFKAATWDEIRKIAENHPVMKGVAQTMYEAVTDRESYRQIREHEKAVLDQQAMQAYAENIGYKKGEVKGEIKGEIKGRIKGKIEA